MNLLDDIRSAWRGLARAPAFLALAAGVLALGLGATICMYGTMRALLLDPPPYPEGDRLIVIQKTEVGRERQASGWHYLDYQALRDGVRSLEDFAAGYTGTAVISGSGLPERLSGGFVTGNVFELLRATALMGRTLTPEDDRYGAQPVAVIGHKLWKNRYAGDPAIIGRSVRLNSRDTTIVGVMPPQFEFPSSTEQVWIPLARNLATESRLDPQAISLSGYARLRAGATLEDAQRELDLVATRLGREHPATNAGTISWVRSFASGTAGDDGEALIRLLFYAVWGVLLIACANVASLIFVRANHRVFESTMRAALGARRPRLVAQTIAESVIIALFGLLGGLVLALIALHYLGVAVTTQLEGVPSWWRFEISWPLVLFGFAVAIGSGLLAGLWPALRASRPDIMRVLRDGGRTGTGLRLSTFTTVMVIVEIGLSAALLTGAGLALRTVQATTAGKSGVDVEGWLSGRVMLPETQYDRDAQAVFFERLARDLAAQPLVRAATATNVIPGTGIDEVPLEIEGRAAARREDYLRASTVGLIGNFFEAFERPLLGGRSFDSRDRLDTEPVAIVNRAFVQRFYPSGSDPIGSRIRLRPEDPQAPWMRIVGIAPDINHDLLRAADGGWPPVVYTSLSQLPERFVSVLVRARSGDAALLAPLLRARVQHADPELPVYFLMSIADRQARERAGFGIISWMFGAFAALAILLAAVGLYGVLAFTTGQRQREIGVRRALGARDRQVLRSVLRGALLQLAIGLGIGMLLAPLMATTLQGILGGGRAHDPIVYGIVLALIVGSALLASWVPALRALRIQPSVALRHE